MTQEQLEPLIIRTFNKKYDRQSPSRKGEINSVKFFECRCSTTNCSNTFIVQKSKIKKSTGLCVSCSNRKEPHLGSFVRMGWSTKYHGFKESMTYDEYIKLCHIPNCHYCGNPLNRRAHSSKDHPADSYMLDRIDNDIGYTVTNCVPCCWDCNRLKSDRFTYEEFKKLRAFIRSEFGR